MRPRSHSATIRARIDALAAGGRGVARTSEGRVVFVSGAAPGDLVEASVSARGSALEGHVLRVIEPGPDRVEPPCPHAGACGGCDWMFLAMAAQERGHAAIVRDAITRALAGDQRANVPAIVVHGARAALGYRTRARLFVKGDRGKVSVGYRAEGSHAIEPIDRCAVLDASIASIPADLKAIFAGARGEGDASIARGAGGLPVIDLRFRGELAAATWSALDRAVSSGAWAGAKITLDGAAAPATFGDPRQVLLGADGAPLVTGGFAQPSDEGAAALAQRVGELAQTSGREVVELFAGSGALSVVLARGAASFTAVEIDAAAAACLRENLAARRLSGKVVAADAEAFAIPPRADVIVLDPPRTGARGAARAIAASRAKRVVYVSCDPPSLGRDLVPIVQAGFSIDAVETFELFPQTSHVEAVLALSRRRASGGKVGSLSS